MTRLLAAARAMIREAERVPVTSHAAEYRIALAELRSAVQESEGRVADVRRIFGEHPRVHVEGVVDGLSLTGSSSKSK